MLNLEVNKKILVAGALLFCIKLVALYKEIFIGQTFGFGLTLDAYYISYALVTFLPSVILALFPALLVPLFISYKKTSQLGSILGVLVLLSIFVGLVNGALLYLFSDSISAFYQASAPQRVLIKAFLEYFSILPLFLIITSIFINLLIATRNNLSFIFEVIPNLSLIAILALTHEYLADFSLSLGVVLGCIFQIFIISAYITNRYGLKLSFIIDRVSMKPFFSLGSGAIVLFFAQFFASPIISIDNYYAVEFGVGSVASYNYAIKFIAIGISILSIIVIRVILPDFAELQNQNKFELLNNRLNEYLLGFIVISVCACWVAVQFIEQLIGLVFQGGRLSVESLSGVVRLTEFGLFQVPFVAANLLIVQIFVVKKMYNSMAAVLISAVFVKYLANILLTKLFGLNGLMLAWAAMYIWSFLCLYMLHRIRLAKMRSHF